jgi:hypothetical protein
LNFTPPALPFFSFDRSMKSSQRGILSPRSIWITLILLAILSIPLYWLDGKSERQAKQEATEKSLNVQTITAIASPPEINNPAAFGMTWGAMPNDKLPASAVWMSCHGQPREGITQPHADSCNPYIGDSSCRLALPILCIQKDASTFESSLAPTTSSAASLNDIATDGWAAGHVASTAPVAGFVIGSLALAHARCEKELGPGWRMAEFHDSIGGQGGWGFVAKRGTQLDTRLRHWVHINDQSGNCWNNKG